MPETETLIEIIAGYLRVRIGQASLGPVDTAIFGLAVAAALLSAFRLWRIGRREDRRDRLTALRGAATNETVRAKPLNWYARLGGIVAASAVSARPSNSDCSPFWLRRGSRHTAVWRPSLPINSVPPL